MMNRRSLLKSFAGLCAYVIGISRLQRAEAQVPDMPSLKAVAQHSGRLLGVFTVAYNVGFEPNEAAIIAREFSMIADGNDLKFSDRLRPTPETYNFTPGDWAIDWAHHNGLLFRGHTLVWHNALPTWFQSYVTKENAERVMTDHITSVMQHYAGKVYSWDVVNEPIYHDGGPDGMRRKPWLDLVGPDYIEIAFRTAAAADPKAKLILNECYIEQDLPAHAQRRDALLRLVTRLKKNKSPITGVGIQSHLLANIPLATSDLKNFLTALKDLGLEIMITEFDVDDSQVPDAARDGAVAERYAEYLELVGPFVRTISFQQLADPAKPQDNLFPKRADGLTHHPNLFDTSYGKKPSYYAVAQALSKLRT